MRSRRGARSALVAGLVCGADGLRLRDRIAGRGPLLDETQTERLGTAYLQCLVHRRIVDPDRGLWNCNYVLELADGDIVLQGLDPRGPGAYEMSVLGGTGAYVGATGDATFTDADGTRPPFPRLEIQTVVDGERKEEGELALRIRIASDNK